MKIKVVQKVYIVYVQNTRTEIKHKNILHAEMSITVLTAFSCSAAEWMGWQHTVANLAHSEMHVYWHVFYQRLSRPRPRPFLCILCIVFYMLA